MTRRVSPQQVSHDDQILAVIRDAERPLTAVEIAERSSTAISHECSGRRHEVPSIFEGYYLSITCMDDFDMVVIRVRGISRDVRRLAKSGLVRRMTATSRWEWAGGDGAAAEIADLERVLALDYGSQR